MHFILGAYGLLVVARYNIIVVPALNLHTQDMEYIFACLDKGEI